LTILKREEDLIKAFVVRQKRERYIGFLQSPERRADFLRSLYHFRDFDSAFIAPLIKGMASPAELVAELRRRGAGAECYVISADPDLDGVTDVLENVIVRVLSGGEGTIVCCVPGCLAYYEGEPPDNRFILHRES
jgi:hypothetical protein